MSVSFAWTSSSASSARCLLPPSATSGPRRGPPAGRGCGSPCAAERGAAGANVPQPGPPPSRAVPRCYRLSPLCNRPRAPWPPMSHTTHTGGSHGTDDPPAAPVSRPSLPLRAVRTLLAIAMVAVIGLTAAVVIVATDDDQVDTASGHRQRGRPRPRPWRDRAIDGGPEEGTRATRSPGAPQPAGTRFDGGPEEGTRGQRVAGRSPATPLRRRPGGGHPRPAGLLGVRQRRGRATSPPPLTARSFAPAARG